MIAGAEHWFQRRRTKTILVGLVASFLTPAPAFAQDPSVWLTPWAPTSVRWPTTGNELSQYGAEQNAYYVHDPALVASTEWFAYGRVVELADMGYLDPSAGALFRAALWNVGAPRAAEWPARLGGNWIPSLSLTYDRRQIGLLAIWVAPDASYIGLVEEVSADRRFYRTTGFGRWSPGQSSTMWSEFGGSDELWHGVHPVFLQLPLPPFGYPYPTLVAPVALQDPVLSQTPVRATFRLANRGQAPLTADGIYLFGKGRNSGHYILTQSASRVTLAPGAVYQYDQPIEFPVGDTYDLFPSLYVNQQIFNGELGNLPIEPGVADRLTVVVPAKADLSLDILGGFGGTVTASVPLICNDPAWGPCRTRVVEGTTILLDTQPSSGSVFTHWEGCDSTAGTHCEVTMTTDRMVVAHFDYRSKSTILSGPTSTPSFVDSIGLVTSTVSATHSLGLALRYRWTVVCSGWSAYVEVWEDGPSTTWVAPANATDRNQDCNVSVQVQDIELGHPASAMSQVTIRPRPPQPLTAAPDADSFGAIQSFSGRYVAFVSFATNLVADDTNRQYDVFRLDRVTGQVKRLSPSPFYFPGYPPILGSLTDDGRIMTLLFAHALQDTNLYEYDWVTEELRSALVSVPDATVIRAQTPGALSVDGRFLAYTAYGAGVRPGTLFWVDRLAGRSVPLRFVRGSDAEQPSVANISLSPDGGWLAFSTISNLTPQIDQNNVDDIFVIDRLNTTLRRVSETATGLGGNAPSSYSAISAGGRVVVFYSRASNLVPDDTNDWPDVFIKDMVSGELIRVPTDAGNGRQLLVQEAPVGISAGGRFVSFVAWDWDWRHTYERSDLTTWIYDRQTRTLVRAGDRMEGVISGDGQWLSYASNIDARWNRSIGPVREIRTREFDWGSNAESYLDQNADGVVDGLTSVQRPLVASTSSDTDADGLPDDWELAFSLDQFSSADSNGPSGDPDGDGRTNAEELQAGTHPRGSFARYLAEGATSTFMTTRLAIFNPDIEHFAHALLRFDGGDGSSHTQRLLVPPASRRTVDVGQLADMAQAEFSTVIESDIPVVTNRTMTWGAGYGSHGEGAVAAPATRWYLAEGATHSGFQLFYLLQNPSASPAVVDISYLFPHPRPSASVTYHLAPHSRLTVWVNRETLVGETDVSAIISSDQPIIVERAMYLNTETQVFAAGHESAGLTTPARQWFLAEGATGRYFDLFILIANPNQDPTQVSVDYLFPDGRVVTKRYDIGGQSRFTVWVDQEGPAFLDTAVSARIESDAPILVERAMWWPGPTAATWTEAHNSPGALESASRWALADGEVGGSLAWETFILVANTSPYEGLVRVTLYNEASGGVQQRTIRLPANSRTNIPVAAPAEYGGFGIGSLGRFSTTVESLPIDGGEAARIVVEQSMYSSTPGHAWDAGTNALGLPLR
ncbi:MAG: TolB family protein [Vicinamibacterales bacterium]